MDARFVHSSAFFSPISPPATNSSAGHSRSRISGKATPLHFLAKEGVSGAAAAAGSSRTRSYRRRIIQCEICAEKKQTCEMMRINKKCVHSFCSVCIAKHVKTRVADNQVTVPCPGLDCKHKVEYKVCVGILPKDVLDAWGKALCEALILEDHKFYCPFRDCSAMLVNDSEKVIEQSECPHCHRLFCAQCHVPWHAGVACMEFQALNEDERGSDDLFLRKLAREKNWGRCPKCKFFVERTQGCPHIICRCKFEFCYGCGSAWSQSHGGCAGD
ncbi:probable E3 ubiquitin-protein ligase RNF217 [Punica granatum]|uniref:RBR-type E3 ubiquitin transferase n=1 Tax=Punica granatum TaxID=22663 RepID=A0A6P8DH96_PUNGR|nr:probable E3 ubiquitin-protein ligase RNF217 [Punica granatum]XP_031392652.1 probable E3 ubiquitin-protein ligase RNF217 [Punica granatum]